MGNDHFFRVAWPVVSEFSDWFAVDDWATDRVEAFYEITVVFVDHVEHFSGYSGHDMLGENHVWRIGELDSDFGERTTDGAHAEWEDVKRVRKIGSDTEK